MFRILAQLLAASGRQRNDVFLIHPLQLSRWLDEAWDSARTAPAFGTVSAVAPFLGNVPVIETFNLPKPQVANGPEIAPSGIVLNDPDVYNDKTLVTPVGLIWDHLIYAYLIESTGIFEIMAEVIRRLVVGETLDTLSQPGLRWVRTTEEMFYREPPLFSIAGVRGEARPDSRTNRRNDMWRMFGMDLPHPVPARRPGGGSGEQGWKADTGSGVNEGFREKWTELLREVWLGIEKSRNETGANSTDREYVAFLANAIKDMLNMRRRGGQLAREEFVHVTTMSWFHLTVESDTPIVQDLKADATNPADRLARIAQRVGMQPATRSRELFELADLMSAFLRAIELGEFDTREKAETLFLPLGTNAQLLRDINRIIDLWQSATGGRVKERPAASVAGGLSAQPLRIPLSGAAPAPAARTGNGEPDGVATLAGEPDEPEESEWVTPFFEQLDFADEVRAEEDEGLAEEEGGGQLDTFAGLVRRGMLSAAVLLAIAGGNRDETALTDRIFHARHPELGGRAPRPGERSLAAEWTGERSLAAEWTGIRDRLVRPLLRTPRPAGGPPAPPGGAPLGRQPRP